MKKFFYSFIATLGLFSFASCGEMLEVDNDSMVTDPSLSSKTDSVFYALGIAQAMQQVADQYFFIGEMRGDLVTTTPSTNTNLRELADYSATASNAYDSAYVYYKVINNCNYYLAKRNTELYTGAINVSEEEYAAVEAWRAWTYLQVARTYGGNEVGVPFFTEPLTSISQIKEENFPKYTLNQIVDALAPGLEKYSGYEVPSFGQNAVGIGTPNWGGGTKNMFPKKLFVPVDVILGELYLEKGEYMKAAQHYALYLCQQRLPIRNVSDLRDIRSLELPLDFLSGANGVSNAFVNIFSTNPGEEVVTYIPMAVNSQRGVTTAIPNAFGYDYYSIEKSGTCPRLDAIQIAPSEEYYDLTTNCDYYYYQADMINNVTYPIGIGKLPMGDGRASVSKGKQNGSILNQDEADTTKVYIAKNVGANVILYRVSTIYLHLAEALNRAGYSDLSFAILRNGISDYLEELITPEGAIYDENGNVKPTDHMYMSRRSVDLLKGPLYFLNEDYMSYFGHDVVYGIHNHGGGFVLSTSNQTEASVQVKGSAATAVGSRLNTMYLPKPIVGDKIAEINAKFGVGANINNPQHFIAAMELVLCDEYAKEFAFEGKRFYDLQRMARHLNESGVFGGNFGSRWFADKLQGNNPSKPLTEAKNWYLPFK